VRVEERVYGRDQMVGPWNEKVRQTAQLGRNLYSVDYSDLSIDIVVHGEAV
jgi:hypothetical protein